jgi:hypothetical protein
VNDGRGFCSPRISGEPLGVVCVFCRLSQGKRKKGAWVEGGGKGEKKGRGRK